MSIASITPRTRPLDPDLRAALAAAIEAHNIEQVARALGITTYATARAHGGLPVQERIRDTIAAGLAGEGKAA